MLTSVPISATEQSLARIANTPSPVRISIRAGERPERSSQTRCEYILVRFVFASMQIRVWEDLSARSPFPDLAKLPSTLAKLLESVGGLYAKRITRHSSEAVVPALVGGFFGAAERRDQSNL